MSRNILAYFKTPEEAEQAAAKLKELGVTEIQLDRFSKYPGSGIEELTNPITGNISSQSEMSLGADVMSRDAGILLATDPSASGMSDGGQQSVSGRDILLGAIVDDSVYEQAITEVHNLDGLA